MPQANHERRPAGSPSPGTSRAGVGALGGVGGEHDGQPVELHRADGGLDPADAEVEGEQPGRRALSRGGK